MKLKYKYLLFLIFIFTIFSCDQNSKKVPIISKSLIINKNKIDALNFRDQLNNPISINTLEGNIHITNFFFTNCKTICPLMEIPLNKITTEHQNIKFLSFTIDPENDTTAVLKKYSDIQNNGNRTFLRGTKKELTEIANYYLSSINSSNQEDLFHTSYVVLVDKKLQIRGLYNSLDKDDLLFLEEDLKALFQE